MKKIVIFIVIGLVLITSYSNASTKRTSAIALEWWLREQDKFEGAKISTKQLSSGEFEITNWEVTGIPRPTDAQLETIISDYEQYLKDKNKARKEKVIRVKTKLKELGINESDLDAIIKGD